MNVFKMGAVILKAKREAYAASERARQQVMNETNNEGWAPGYIPADWDVVRVGPKGEVEFATCKQFYKTE